MNATVRQATPQYIVYHGADPGPRILTFVVTRKFFEEMTNVYKQRELASHKA